MNHLYKPGVANSNRSIAESQLVDRAWICIELTRYLKRTTFSINIPESFVLLRLNLLDQGKLPIVFPLSGMLCL